MLSFRKFWEGIRIVAKAATSSTTKGDLEVLDSDSKIYYHNGTINSPLVTEAGTATLTNKTFDASTNTITNITNTNIAAGAAIDASKIADGTVSSAEFQFINSVTSNVQTQLNGKASSTLTSAHIFVGNGSNIATDVAVSGDLTLTNTGDFEIAAGAIVNADINAAAAIDASKIADGTVSSAEFQFINSLTSNAQTQLDARVTGPASSVDGEVALFNGTTGKIIKRATGTGVAHLTSGVLSVSNVLLSSEVTGTLPIANGGTNSSTALSGSSIMVSNGTSIVQGTAGTTTTVLHGNASGTPTYGAVSLTTDVSGVLPLANGGTNKNMTAVAGAVVWTDSDSQELTAAGTTGQFLISGGTGSPTWSSVSPGAIQIATISDVKAANTSGGTATSGSFQTRTLNTLVDASSIVTSLSSNQFVLPSGTYYIEVIAPAYETDRHQAKLRNITDSTDALTGTSCFGSTVDAVMTNSEIKGTVTIIASKTFEIQHRVGTTSTTRGFGVESNFGINETYTIVKIMKIS